MVNDRQRLILRHLINQYIDGAQPVGSKTLAQGCGLDVSPATIRNDLAVLEQEGFLIQPHTSAGRVPTEAAYRYYLSHFVRPRQNIHWRQKFCARLHAVAVAEEAVKQLAKEAAEISGETVLVAFGRHTSYYTGVSHLLSKPDFLVPASVATIGALVDRFDEILSSLLSTVSVQPRVWVGSENPFGKQMTAMLVSYRVSSSCAGVFGLIGPLRMDYERNLSLIEAVRLACDDAYARRS